MKTRRSSCKLRRQQVSITLD